jgi:5'-methylthioadenosine phosphorylase
MTTIGIIGGSGLYRMAALHGAREEKVDTPFGAPSDPFVVGTIGDVRAVFLARHGRGHRLLPTEINFRANIFGFRMLGVERLIAVSAVGSLREDLGPLDVVLPDQFIDWTRRRPSTFFGDGLVAHVSLADPVCPDLAAVLQAAAARAGVRAHRGGTYLCIEGPQFSTRAESHLFRSFKADVIGMTNVQEAKLAREAEICYAVMAMVTDYDCWREESAPVTVGEVVARLQQNARAAETILAGAAAALPAARSCACARALENAILTDPAAVPAETRARLRPILGPRIP